MSRFNRVCKRVKPDDFDYVYDNIGNRLSTTNNGSSTSYSANSLNQYTNVNGSVPTYDSDGNMLTNGDWTYTWNGENRLISASNGTTVVSFGYDYMGRRFEKAVGGTNTTFIYDGWNMVRETSSTETNHYVWGLDLSQSLQGAGGVGGLLAVNEDDGGVYFPSIDANGNITGYIDDAGAVKAVYVYDAFGGILSDSGTTKHDLKFRFSTKYQDETGLNYYGYRYYDAELGRWLSRDPIEEEGGVNIYGFVWNDGVNLLDLLGLDEVPDFSGAAPCVYGCHPHTPIPPSAPNQAATAFGVPTGQDLQDDGRYIRSQNDPDQHYERWYEYRFPNTLQSVQDQLRDNLNRRFCESSDPSSVQCGISGSGKKTKHTTEWSLVMDSFNARDE